MADTEHPSLQSQIRTARGEHNLLRPIFTVARNPWQRAFSLWRWYVCHKYAQLHKPEHRASFEAWLKDGAPHLMEPFYYNDGVTNILDHLSYCKRVDGTLGIDEWLKFENLPEDFKKISDKPLPYVGEFEPFLYQEKYTSQWMIDYVASLNEGLIAMFNYTF